MVKEPTIMLTKDTKCLYTRLAVTQPKPALTAARVIAGWHHRECGHSVDVVSSSKPHATVPPVPD